MSRRLLSAVIFLALSSFAFAQADSKAADKSSGQKPAEAQKSGDAQKPADAQKSGDASKPADASAQRGNRGGDERAQEGGPGGRPRDPLAAAIGGLKWRNIGPAMVS